METAATQDRGDAAEGEQSDDAEDGYDADDDEHVDKVKPGFTYNWAAYHAKFGDTPLHEAVTSMSAEYASLYMRIAGQVGASVPAPLTLQVADDISKQAERFIWEYVTPILGQMNSTKFHRLLCHIRDTIKNHGNLRNGNTASNESQHKEDKVFYTRTSKQLAFFTGQLVRQAQGLRTIIDTLDRDDMAAGRAAGKQPVEQPCSSDDDDETYTSDSSRGEAREDAAPTGQGQLAPPQGVHQSVGAHPAVDARAAAAGGGRRGAANDDGDAERPRSVHHLPHEKVESIARRPGLGSLSSMLGSPPDHLLPVLGHVRISATFDCGMRARQIVRASRSFRGAPWLDSVMYSVGSDTQTVFVGEVRVLLRLPHGDVAVLCEMAPVDPVAGCPLAARGCTRLRWHQRPGEADCALRVVPAKDLRRVVHVVPDLLDLGQRRGLSAAPAGERDLVHDRLAMKFFLNVFYPWDVPR